MKAKGPEANKERPAAKSQIKMPGTEAFVDLKLFLGQVYFEFKKITWPERSQILRETYSVLFLVTIITLMVLGFDWAIARAVFEPMEKFAKSIGGGVGAHTLMPSGQKDNQR